MSHLYMGVLGSELLFGKLTIGGSDWMSSYRTTNNLLCRKGYGGSRYSLILISRLVHIPVVLRGPISKCGGCDITDNPHAIPV